MNEQSRDTATFALKTRDWFTSLPNGELSIWFESRTSWRHFRRDCTCGFVWAFRFPPPIELTATI